MNVKLKNEIESKSLAIFDFDGLMVNSEEVIFQSLKALFKTYDRELTWEYFVQHIGKPVAIVLPRFHSDYALPISYERFLTERKTSIDTYMPQYLKLTPGLLDLLRILKKKSVKMAVATSGHRTYVEPLLLKFDIANYFSHVTTIEDVEQGKPNPALFLHALEKTHGNARSAFVLEDAPSGIQAAYAAGITSIAVPTRGVSHTLFSKATYVVESLTDLVKVLK